MNPIYLQTLPSQTGANFTTGMDQLVVFVATEVPIFTPMVLFSIFMIVMLSGFFSQQRREGRGDFPQWFAVAGFFTAIVSIVMSMIEGLVSTSTMVITVTVAIAGAAWLFFSRDR